jgi:murein DD-endopeptidase MepM/ murein hydrolase activator NlpD
MEPTWGNPVDGVILPRGTFGNNGEMRPAGDTTFEVTFTFQEHADNNRGLGTDIGNARCDALVRAMADGKVVQREPDPGNGALIVRIKHGDSGFSSGYAHMSSFSVLLGQDVIRGDPIGVVGNTGADFCHLHFDISKGSDTLDPWPRLEQNQEADMEITIVRYPSPRTWHTRAGMLTGRRLTPVPLTNSTSFDAGSPAEADGEVTVKPTPAGWPPGPYLSVSTGGMKDFLVAFSDVDPGAAPLPAAAQIEAATAPLNAEIMGLTAEITDLKQQLKSVRHQLAALSAGLPVDGGP